MKKILCLLTLLSTAFLYGEEREEKPYFFYTQGQFVAFIPTFGFGIRGQTGVNGFDLSDSLIFSSPLVGTHLKALYLLHPDKGGFYFGAGAGLLAGASPMSHWHGGCAATAESAIGFQWKNQKFLELTTITILDKDADFITLPGLTLGFGF